MDISTMPRSYGATLPSWVFDELNAVPNTLATDEERMSLVHKLAARNPVEGSGGPFAALVVDSGTGEIVSAGVNLVLASGLSAAHAEIVALSLAQTRVGGWDLGAAGAPDRELVVNWRPCAQCYGATLWSGVERLVVAGEGPELEQLTGFDEGPMRADWAEQFRSRGIEVVSDVLREQALEVFAAYSRMAADHGLTVYNARGTARGSLRAVPIRGRTVPATTSLPAGGARGMSVPLANFRDVLISRKKRGYANDHRGHYLSRTVRRRRFGTQVL
ncbi:nucleoside deaminase [Nocardia sp. GCM10030253]|uniref:nucleoside deaminase n=1 Tax=Nocardia sp. GCM10030253 TaxID=3273404 RepID=UPI00363521BB